MSKGVDVGSVWRPKPHSGMRAWLKAVSHNRGGLVRMQSITPAGETRKNFSWWDPAVLRQNYELVRMDPAPPHQPEQSEKGEG